MYEKEQEVLKVYWFQPPVELPIITCTNLAALKFNSISLVFGTLRFTVSKSCDTIGQIGQKQDQEII